MYPAELVAPMKSELTAVGFVDLHTPEQVDKALSQPGTVLCVVNSVCGCAAGAARPGVKQSLNGETKHVSISCLIRQVALQWDCSRMVSLCIFWSAIT